MVFNGFKSFTGSRVNCEGVWKREYTHTHTHTHTHAHTPPQWIPQLNLHPWHAVLTRAFIMTQQSDFLSPCWRQAVSLMRCMLALKVLGRQIGPPANWVHRGRTSPWQPCRRTVWATWPSLHNLTLSVSSHILRGAKTRAHRTGFREGMCNNKLDHNIRKWCIFYSSGS